MGLALRVPLRRRGKTGPVLLMTSAYTRRLGQGEPPQDSGRVVRRLLRMSWQYRWGCIKVLALQMVLLAMGLSGLGLTGLGIDVIRHAVQPSSKAPVWPFGFCPPEGWSPIYSVIVVAGGILAFAVFRSAINGFYSFAMGVLLQGKIVVDLRAKVYDKLQRLSFRFFDDNATGSIINRVTGDVQAVRMFVDGVVMQVIILAISLGIYLTYMLSIHVWLTAACLATTPLIYLVALVYSRVVQPAYLRERELFDELVLGLSESVQGMSVVKGFAREGLEVEKFKAAGARLTAQKNWIFWRATTYPQFIGFLTQFNLVVLIAYGGWLVIEGKLPLGTGMVVFAGLLQQFSGQVTNLANVANTMQQSLTAARRVFEVLDAPTEIRSAAGARPMGKARGCVEFDRVTFGYNPDSSVLEDLSLRVEAGMCVAVLGATGSGKSTLLSLIPRFYDPREGRVLVDGMDVRGVRLDDLRRNIGIVFQESFLFSTTVAQNIAFGHPDSTREQVEKAARIAAAHEFIMALPKGYDTVLREAGADLSGGQRQRLAIARAVLLEPAILLLDDPTAAIDPETEEEIMAAMESAMAGRTTFVIAHRLSTLKRADIVLVLERGRLVQAGTHEQLMACQGPYRLAARMQVADDVSRRLLHQQAAEGQGT